MAIRFFDAVLKKQPEDWPQSFRVTVDRLGPNPSLGDADAINQSIYDVLDEEEKKAFWAAQLNLDARRHKINGDP